MSPKEEGVGHELAVATISVAKRLSTRGSAEYTAAELDEEKRPRTAASPQDLRRPPTRYGSPEPPDKTMSAKTPAVAKRQVTPFRRRSVLKTSTSPRPDEVSAAVHPSSRFLASMDPTSSSVVASWPDGKGVMLFSRAQVRSISTRCLPLGARPDTSNSWRSSTIASISGRRRKANDEEGIRPIIRSYTSLSGLPTAPTPSRPIRRDMSDEGKQTRRQEAREYSDLISLPRPRVASPTLENDHVRHGDSIVTPTSKAIAVRTYVAKITGRGSGGISPSTLPGSFLSSPTPVKQVNGSSNAGKDQSLEPSPCSTVSSSTNAPSSAAMPTPKGMASPRAAVQRLHQLKRRESDGGTPGSSSCKNPSSWSNYSVLGFRADTNETRKVDEMLAHKKAGSREQGSGADAVGVEGVSPSSDVGTTTDTRSVVKLSGASRSCNGLSLGVSAGVDNSLAGGVVGSGGISPISVSELAQKVSALAADVVSVFSKREDKGQTPVR